MALRISADSVFRDFEVDGVPASGKHKVDKSEIRQLLRAFDPYLPIKPVTGPKTIDDALNGFYLMSTDEAQVVWTLNDDATPGTMIMWLQYGTGQIKFLADIDATIVCRFPGLNASADQYSEGTAKCVDNPDGAHAVWLIDGDLGAV